MKSLTLTQIGRRVVRSVCELSPVQRRTLTFQNLIRRLKIPVGGRKS